MSYFNNNTLIKKNSKSFIKFCFTHSLCPTNLICMKKSANGALNIVLFYTLVLMLLTKFLSKRTTRRWTSGIRLLNFDDKLAPNLMLKCLVGKEQMQNWNLPKWQNPVLNYVFKGQDLVRTYKHNQPCCSQFKNWLHIFFRFLS